MGSEQGGEVEGDMRKEVGLEGGGSTGKRCPLGTLLYRNSGVEAPEAHQIRCPREEAGA